MYKIGVLGDYDSICGFLSLGVDVFAVDDAKDVSDTLSECVSKNYAIIYITENKLALIQNEIDKYKNLRIPAIIPIPGIGGSLGIGRTNVKKSVERAVGSDILSND